MHVKLLTWQCVLARKVKKLTYADFTSMSPKVSPLGMFIGSEELSGPVLSSSLAPGNFVRSTNCRGTELPMT